MKPMLMLREHQPAAEAPIGRDRRHNARPGLVVHPREGEHAAVVEVPVVVSAGPVPAETAAVLQGLLNEVRLASEQAAQRAEAERAAREREARPTQRVAYSHD